MRRAIAGTVQPHRGRRLARFDVIAFPRLCTTRPPDSSAGVAMRAPAYEEAREDGLRPGDADTRGMKQILGAFAILILSAAAADAQTCMGGTELGRSAHNRLL